MAQNVSSKHNSPIGHRSHRHTRNPLQLFVDKNPQPDSNHLSTDVGRWVFVLRGVMVYYCVRCLDVEENINNISKWVKVYISSE